MDFSCGWGRASALTITRGAQLKSNVLGTEHVLAISVGVAMATPWL